MKFLICIDLAGASLSAVAWCLGSMVGILGMLYFGTQMAAEWRAFWSDEP